MGAGEGGYGFAAAAAILGLSESRLRYWAQIGFVGPSRRVGSKQVYTFEDLVSAKAAKELTDRGFSTAEIRSALERVRATLPDVGRPLDHLRVAFDGHELVVVDEAGAFALSGQRVFDFGLGELRARASSFSTTPWGKTPAPEAVPQRSAYAWFQQGLRLEGEDKPDEAAASYRKALVLDPGLGAAHTNLGVLAHRSGRAAEARAAFEAALAVDPDQPEARYDLAHLLFEAGELDLAAAELRRVLQLRPDFADAHYNLATALEALGGRRQAREHLERFLALRPEGDQSLEAWAAEARTRLHALG
jgi:tetratricopeptide (TPR) repeat protein